MDVQKRLAQIINELKVLGFKEDAKKILKMAEWENKENEPLPRPAPEFFENAFKNDDLKGENWNESSGVPEGFHGDEPDEEDPEISEYTQWRNEIFEPSVPMFTDLVDEWLSDPPIDLFGDELDKLTTLNNHGKFVPVLIAYYATSPRPDKDQAMTWISQTAVLILNHVNQIERSRNSE